MTKYPATGALKDWLRHARGPSLYFPWGWYGRPYDNAHMLTGSIFSRAEVALEFDESILIVASGIGSITVDSTLDPGPAPRASTEWTTVTVDGLALLSLIWSESEFEERGDVQMQVERNTFFVMVAPRPD